MLMVSERVRRAVQEPLEPLAVTSSLGLMDVGRMEMREMPKPKSKERIDGVS